MREPFEDCPSFESCSCNVCPLDPKSELHGGKRVALPGEESCRARRSAREKVAIAYGYDPGWARLPREIRRDAARARFLALPPEERERRLNAAGRKAGGKSLENRASRNGMGSVPSPLADDSPGAGVE